MKHTEARFSGFTWTNNGPGKVNWYAVNKRGTRNQTGNVWEWMRDDVDGYKRIRGGSWDNNRFGGLRADGLSYGDPGVRDGVVGFRCVAPPQDSKK